MSNIATLDLQTTKEVLSLSDASCLKPINIDIDASDDLAHGQQEQVFFNPYYHHECFAPLLIFSGTHLLAAQLRPFSSHGQRPLSASITSNSPIWQPLLSTSI